MKKPKREDFGYDWQYYEALEKYCDELEEGIKNYLDKKSNYELSLAEHRLKVLAGRESEYEGDPQ